MAFDLQRLYRWQGSSSTPNWIVCTKSPVTKHLSCGEIESIDIAKTCDSLRSAIMLTYNRQEHAELMPATATTTTATTVQTDSLPHKELNGLTFRSCAYLCNYLLRIYQQQVNYLLEKSKTLLRASKFQMVTLFGFNNKRKSGTEKADNKRKRFEATKHQWDSPINTYDEFLNEVLELQNWARTHEFTLDTSTPTKGGRRRVSQISKMVITEVITDVAVDDFDGDSGFGEATEEEIAEFRDLFKSNSWELQSPKEATKRKISIHEPPNNKRCKMGEEDHSFENSDTHNQTPVNVVCCPDISSMFLEGAHSDDDVAIDTVMPAAVVANPKPSTSPEDVAKRAISIKNPKHKRSCPSSQLIFDEITQIPHCEMRNQIKNTTTCTRPMAIVPVEKLPKLRINKCPLSTKDSASIFTKLTERQKPVVDPLKEQTAYTDILHGMFGRYPSDELAKAVCPKRDRATKPRRAQKRQISKRQMQLPATFTPPNNNNNNHSTEFNIEQEHDVEDTKYEWSTSGVLMKLVHKWQSAGTNPMSTEINAEHILCSTNSRANAALAFSSLLHLAARRYIVITKAENSMEMHSIKIGQAAENLIQPQ